MEPVIRSRPWPPAGKRDNPATPAVANEGLSTSAPISSRSWRKSSRSTRAARRARITKQRALLKSLAARGIQGDARAANLILSLISRLLQPEEQPAGPQDLGTEDKAILDAYLAKEITNKDIAK